MSQKGIMSKRKRIPGASEPDFTSEGCGLVHVGNFVRGSEVVKISKIACAEALKSLRFETLSGLTSSIKELGVAVPIQLMSLKTGKVSDTVSDTSEGCDTGDENAEGGRAEGESAEGESAEDESAEDESMEDAEDDVEYALIDGARRIYGCLRAGLTDIPAVVWHFDGVDLDAARGSLLALHAIINRAQKSTWKELWGFYRVLEKQGISATDLEYLLQLEPGDSLKLKAVFLDGDEDLLDSLNTGKKTLEACYKAYLKKQGGLKEKLDAADVCKGAIGVSDKILRTGQGDVLTPEQAKSEMEFGSGGASKAELGSEPEALLSESSVPMPGWEGSMGSSVKGSESEPSGDLKSAVFARDNFKCVCCGTGGSAFLGALVLRHRRGGANTEENLVTLCESCSSVLCGIEQEGGQLSITDKQMAEYSPEEQKRLNKILELAEESKGIPSEGVSSDLSVLRKAYATFVGGTGTGKKGSGASSGSTGKKVSGASPEGAGIEVPDTSMVSTDLDSLSDD